MCFSDHNVEVALFISFLKHEKMTFVKNSKKKKTLDSYVVESYFLLSESNKRTFSSEYI